MYIIKVELYKYIFSTDLLVYKIFCPSIIVYLEISKCVLVLLKISKMASTIVLLFSDIFLNREFMLVYQETKKH